MVSLPSYPFRRRVLGYRNATRKSQTDEPNDLVRRESVQRVRPSRTEEGIAVGDVPPSTEQCGDDPDTEFAAYVCTSGR